MNNFFRAVLFFLTLIFVSCKKEEPAPLPFADFFVENSACTSPCWVKFYDQSLNAVEWEWNFGNNFYSSSQNDSNYYTEFGIYKVRLKVKNADGVLDSVTKDVLVY